jgi:hypothetical protein
MFYSLGAYQFIGQPPYLPGLALDDHNFQAMVRIKMNMQGGNYIPVMRMLMLGQFIGQLPGVMVKYQGNGPNHFFFIFMVPFIFDQGISDQVPNRFRPVAVSFVRDQQVEFLQQPLINRHPEPYCFRHWHILPIFYFVSQPSGNSTPAT